MTSNQIAEFLKQNDELENRSTGNSRSGMFTKRARQLIVTAYKQDGKGIWQAREGKDTTAADKLIGMGFVKAIYGAGRSLLQ